MRLGKISLLLMRTMSEEIGCESGDGEDDDVEKY